MPRPFPLTPVLRLREQKEQAEERALAVINKDLQDVQAAQRRLEHEAARFRALRQQLTDGVMSAANHQMLAVQWRSLQEAQVQLKQRLQSLEASRVEQMNRLIGARRERETLSELRKLHLHRAQEHEQRAERKRIDDLFSSRHKNCAEGASDFGPSLSKKS